MVTVRGALRALLVVGGLLLVFAGVALWLSIPPPPPGSDGFPAGLAYGFGLLVIAAGFGLAGLGLLVGSGESRVFSDSQNRVLRASGGLVLASFVIGIALFFGLNRLMLALDVWAGLLGLGILGVVATLLWRAGEAVLEALG